MYFQVFVQFSPLSLLSSYLPKWDCTSKHMIHALPRKQRKPSPGKCPVCQIPTNSTKETLNQMQIHAIPSILKLHAALSNVIRFIIAPHSPFYVFTSSYLRRFRVLYRLR